MKSGIIDENEEPDPEKILEIESFLGINTSEIDSVLDRFLTGEPPN